MKPIVMSKCHERVTVTNNNCILSMLLQSFNMTQLSNIRTKLLLGIALSSATQCIATQSLLENKEQYKYTLQSRIH